jgi:hypothetical protein
MNLVHKLFAVLSAVLMWLPCVWLLRYSLASLASLVGPGARRGGQVDYKT